MTNPLPETTSPQATPQTDPAPPPSRHPLTMKAFGVGGAGCNALAHLARGGLAGVDCVAMNTDAAALERCPVAHQLPLGAQLTRGLGAGGDPDRGRAAAEEDAARVRTLCEGTDVLVLLAGLGGGTGTGASPVIAEIARQCGALVLGLVVTPFDWEGERRRRQAQLGLQHLKAAADAVVCLPNQKLFTLVSNRTSVTEGFAIVNELLAQGVRGLWRLLTRPGLINVDFADVCTATRDRHAECALASAEATGEGRAKELLEKLLQHPLLEHGQALDDAAVVLVSLAGGPDLSLTDVNSVMEQIHRHAEHAHIIMGAAVDEAAAGRLAVTVLASRRGDHEQAAAAEPDAANPALETPIETPGGTRPTSRFVAPPPRLTPENAAYLLQDQPPRVRKKAIKMVQAQLPLEIHSKGRFQNSEPTIRSGQDLDEPTYLRRKLVFN